MNVPKFGYLRQLEAESIYILREVAAQFDNPVMLYSIGKDSSVLLHLAMKAFYPSKLPFPLLHVDTTWKFREMIAFRDETTSRLGVDLIVHTNQDGLKRGIGPFTHGSSLHTEVMKTQALKQALDSHGFDAAIGGARRDEEKSRAKERVFSFRTTDHRWDPKNQRPELWWNYNGRIAKGESIRAFPLSNWTEMDVWEYIKKENLEVPNIYFSHQRECFRRAGQWLPVPPAHAANGKADPYEGARPTDAAAHRTMVCRVRTIADMISTGMIESPAETIDDIIAEVAAARVTERGSRADDKASEAAMEDRKKAGYF